MYNRLTEAEFLRNKEYAEQKLNNALTNAVGSLETDELMYILRKLIKQNGGITKLSQHTGINRQRIYRCLEEGGNPKLKSLLAILNYLDLHLTIEPKGKKTNDE